MKGGEGWRREERDRAFVVNEKLTSSGQHVMNMLDDDSSRISSDFDAGTRRSAFAIKKHCRLFCIHWELCLLVKIDDPAVCF